MPDAYVGAIDQGTTGTRSAIVDGEGRIVGSAYRTHEQHYPSPGRVEHDPVELWESARATTRRALESAGLDAADLDAIGVANQRETTVVWDAETGEPVDRAIVWQDRRTTPRVEALIEAGQEAWIRETTGLPVDAYFSATKLEWLLNHHGLGDRAAEGDLHFGTVDTWLVWKLTGAHVTDVTNAARTMLFDVDALEWDDELLAEFGVPRAMLPTVRPSVPSAPYGVTDPEILGSAVPVAGALGDQQAALFGQTCFDAGEAKNTYGTGSFLLANTGTERVESDHGLVSTPAYQRAGERARYALEGSIFATGAAIQWLVDVGLIDDPGDSEAIASRVDSTDDVYLVPAFAGLGAPHWDGRARGTIVGLTRGTGRAELVRAAIESTAFQTRDVAEAVADDVGEPIRDLRVDGGGTSNSLLCQLQADLLGTEVVRPVETETTALGAAFAAGLAVGVWDSTADLRERWRVDRRFDPSVPASEADARHERWREAVSRSTGWAREE